MSKVQISVIVPVYNVELYLKECIESVLNQDYMDYELILVDDGSTDSSGQLCENYQKQNDRVKVYHKQNEGQATARNYGFKRSIGEYICYVDSDDVVHPQLLSSLMACIEKTDTKIAMCSAYIDSSVSESFFQQVNCSPAVRSVDEAFFNSMTEANWEQQGIKLDVIWGKLIHRSIIEQFPFSEGRIYEDRAIVCSWLDAAEQVSDCNEQLYFYRKRENSTISSKFSLKRLDQLWADEEIEHFYRTRGYKKMVAFASFSFCEHAMLIEKQLSDYSEWELMMAVRVRKRKKILQNIFRWNLSKNDFFYYLSEAWPSVGAMLHLYERIKNIFRRMNNHE